MTSWTAQNIPDQSGKVAVITGANSGLGYWTTLALARKNTHVIMAVRNMQKGESARAKVLNEAPGATVELMQLDLASLDSIRAFAESYKARFQQLDMLINNAGLMAIPQSKTKDGFETQFGVNHLGHFALTGLLYPVIASTLNSRVVNVSSNYHRMGKMNFDDLMSEKDYGKWRAYQQSKLANLLFAYELQRKFEREGLSAQSMGAHPGYAATELQKMGSNSLDIFSWLGNTLIAQSAEKGALPQLYAATSPNAQGGKYYGPDGFMHMRGYPEEEQSSDASYNIPNAKRLWEVSEQLTGITYPIPEMA